MNRETLIKEWIRVRAELDTLEKKLASTFVEDAKVEPKIEPTVESKIESKVESVVDAKTRTRTKYFVNFRLPVVNRASILARLDKSSRPMEATEIAEGLRNNPKTSATTLVHGILRNLVAEGVVQRTKGPRGVLVFQSTPGTLFRETSNGF